LGKIALEMINVALLIPQFILPELQVLLQLPAVFLQSPAPAFLELDDAY
jgi:hypothetical protein